MYTLYTGDNCHQCAVVEQYLVKRNVDFRKINVDHSEERPPVQIYAFPALFKGEELIGYGTDIQKYVQKKSQS